MPGQDRNPYLALGLVSGIGLNWAASIVIGLYGGRWLDGHFRTTPTLTIVGILLGTVAGAVGTYKMVVRFWR